MIYRRVGCTQLEVSALAFGTASLRLVSERQGVAALVAAFRAGINLVHTAPDYEGADELVRLALLECTPPRPLVVATNAWGTVAYCERVFEETCRRFGTERLGLFGIASLYDREQVGDNIWGPAGMVEFLLRKKAEGRLTAAFCSTHGPADHTIALLQRRVFDAVMLAWNPLKFHLLSYNPATLWSVAGEPPPADWRFENLHRVEAEVFPVARATGSSLFIMKPLAGGLLARGGAFTCRTDFTQPQPKVRPAAILRAILGHDAVCSVVTGMAHPAEVLENLEACSPATPNEHAALTATVDAFASAMCSRCGRCDGTCSHGLPISWLFRAAYLHLFPSVTHELDARFEYRVLHPADRATCLDCTDRTCRGSCHLDIGALLPLLHNHVTRLHQTGQLPVRAPSPPPAQRYGMRVIYQDVPHTVPAGTTVDLRFFLQNTGQAGWWDRPGPGHSFVRMALYVDDAHTVSATLRVDVPPGGRAHFIVPFTAPLRAGPCQLRLELFEHDVAFFRENGVAPLLFSIVIE